MLSARGPSRRCGFKEVIPSSSHRPAHPPAPSQASGGGSLTHAASGGVRGGVKSLQVVSPDGGGGSNVGCLCTDDEKVTGYSNLCTWQDFYRLVYAHDKDFFYVLPVASVGPLEGPHGRPQPVNDADEFYL